MRYSDNIDYLVPSIFYLATNEGWWARSAQEMARELSLDKHHLLRVFEGFPGIFRKSLVVDQHDKRHFFALQARYAGRTGDDLGEGERAIDVPPLSKDHLKLILDFVQQTAESEQLNRRTMITGSIAMLAALVAASSALGVALMKSPDAGADHRITAAEIHCNSVPPEETR